MKIGIVEDEAVWRDKIQTISVLLIPPPIIITCINMTLNVSMIPVKYMRAALNTIKCPKRSSKNKQIESTLQTI